MRRFRGMNSRCKCMRSGSLNFSKYVVALNLVDT